MFVPLIGYVGVQPFNDWFLPDATSRLPLGSQLPAVDPFWGQGTFLYVKASGTLPKGTLVQWDEAFTATAVPNTANLGVSWGVTMAPMAADQFGWVQVQGVAVYRTSATVAADAAVGLTGAGVLGANTAGKQALGVRNRRSATATRVIQNVSTVQNSNLLQMSGYDGLFLGMALSGTGIPASTVVAALGSDGRTVVMGSAVGVTNDRVASATGVIALTGTYTGYGAGVINFPFIQGAIT